MSAHDRRPPVSEGDSPDPADWTARAMAAAVRARRIGAVELLDAHLARIAAVEPAVNAFAVTDFDRARAAAERADQVVARGEAPGLLHGVPVTVKECLATAGLERREASLLRPLERAAQDAEVVARLRGAGAVVLGTTNVSELASFPDTTNLVYGATRNPHDLDRSVSGSSGGEAAAIASGMSAGGVGSDYGGSVRGPAHATGIVGLRCTPGAVPFAGHAPERLTPARALWSTLGPLARTPDDAVLLLAAMRGERAPVDLEPVGPHPRRVTVVADHAARAIASDVHEAVHRAATALEGAGYRIAEAVPPGARAAEEMFAAVTAAETRFTIAELVAGGDAGLLSPQVAVQWEALRDRPPDLDRYLTAFSQRPRLQAEMDAWLDRHPILLAPVAATPAPPVGALAATVGGRDVGLLDLYPACTTASALSLPAASVPVSMTAAGLPVGVQLVGRRRREHEVLAVARDLFVATGERGARPHRLR